MGRAACAPPCVVVRPKRAPWLALDAERPTRGGLVPRHAHFSLAFLSSAPPAAAAADAMAPATRPPQPQLQARPTPPPGCRSYVARLRAVRVEEVRGMGGRGRERAAAAARAATD
eukprot:350066-Chlamydomonas_euryale.AAC.9